MTVNLNSLLTQTGTYLIAGYNGALVNTALLVGGANFNGVTYSFQNNPASLANAAIYANELDLVVTAIPEPSTWALCGLGAGLLGLVLARQRHRRTV